MDPSNLLDEIRGKGASDVNDGVPDEVRSKSPDELHQLIQICDAHLRSLHEGDSGELRDLTPTEDQAFQYLLLIRAAAMKKIEEHRALAEVFARRPESVKRIYANLRDGLADSVGVVRLSNAEARDMALRKLDDRGGTAHLKSDEKDEIERQVRSSTDIARRILVTETDAYRDAWHKMVTRPNGAMYLNDEERDAMRAWDEYRTMSEGTNGAGGFGIPVKLAA